MSGAEVVILALFWLVPIAVAAAVYRTIRGRHSTSGRLRGRTRLEASQ